MGVFSSVNQILRGATSAAISQANGGNASAPGSSDPYYSIWSNWYNSVWLPAIEKYKGTQYYDQLANNAYAQYAKFSPSGLAGSDLGGLVDMVTGGLVSNNANAAAQAYYQSRGDQALEQLNRIQSQIQQNQFNSTANKVAMDAAGGMNDALAGGTSQSDAAGGSEDQSGAMDMVAAQQMSEQGIQMIGNAAQKLVGGFLSGYMQLQQFKSLNIANTASEIDLMDKTYSYAVKSAAGMSSLPGTRAEYDALTDEEKLSVDETLYQNLQAAVKSGYYKSMGLSRRAQSMLKTMTGQVMYDKDGKPTLAFQRQRATMLREYYGNSVEAAKSAGHPVFDPDFSKSVELAVSFFGELETKFNEAQKKIAENSGKLSDLAVAGKSLENAIAGQELIGVTAESGYKKDLYGQTSDGQSLGAVEGQARIKDALARELENELDASLNKFLDGLDGQGTTGQLMKLGALGLRSLIKTLIQSISFSPGKAGGFGFN